MNKALYILVVMLKIYCAKYENRMFCTIKYITQIELNAVLTHNDSKIVKTH